MHNNCCINKVSLHLLLTIEWLLSSMSSHVWFKTRPFCKCHITVAALVWFSPVWLLICVKKVYFLGVKSLLHWVHWYILPQYERAYGSSDFFLLIIPVTLAACFGAFRTLNFPCMQHHMSVKNTLRCKSSVTQAALIWILCSSIFTNITYYLCNHDNCDINLININWYLPICSFTFKFINDLWATDICPNITWVYYLLQTVHTYGITGLKQIKIHTNTKEYTNKKQIAAIYSPPNY